MLDIKTVMVTYLISSMINTFVMYIFWRQNRKEVYGISHWLAGMVLQTIGIMLIALRGLISDVLSILISNIIIAIAGFLIYKGFQLLCSKKVTNIHNYLLLFVFSLLFAYFTFYMPNSAMRILLISVCLSLLFIQSAWLMLFSVNLELRKITKVPGIVLFSYVLIQIYRIIIAFYIPSSEYLKTNIYDPIGLMMNQFLTVIMIFVMITLVDNINIHKSDKIEKELTKSKDAISYLYNNAPCGYQSLDENGLFLDVNDTELDWLGYSRDEVVKKIKFTDIITLESLDNFNIYFTLLKTRGWINDVRLELVTKNGPILPVIINSKAIYDKDKKYLYDLTTIFNRMEINRIEAELHKEREIAVNANQTKSEFLSRMSHDLRTPLNSIITLSGVLERSLAGKIPKEEHSYLEVVESSGKNLLKIINDILDVSRIESGKVEIMMERFDINSLIRDISDMLKPMIQQKNIEIIHKNADKGLFIVTDEDKLGHIIQNVMSNAVKFTEKGYVEVAVVMENETVVITVSDTGIGIDNNNLQNVFEEFVQVDSSSTRKYGGSGLGLAISKKYTELLGGEINVQSELGQGSVFTMKIPTMACK